MNTISSFASTVGLYQTIDRNSFAQSADAIDGARQAFRDTDRKSGSNDQEDENYDASFPMEAVEDTAADAAVINHRYVLNVTA